MILFVLAVQELKCYLFTKIKQLCMKRNMIIKI